MKDTILFYFVSILPVLKRLWYQNTVKSSLGSNCRLQLCTSESNFILYITLSCKVNDTEAALTTRKLMLGFAEPQSVYFTSSARRRGLFLLHVWPTAHWYSQHKHSVNTRDHSQARVLFTAAALYS